MQNPIFRGWKNEIELKFMGQIGFNIRKYTIIETVSNDF